MKLSIVLTCDRRAIASLPSHVHAEGRCVFQEPRYSFRPTYYLAAYAMEKRGREDGALRLANTAPGKTTIVSIVGGRALWRPVPLSLLGTQHPGRSMRVSPLQGHKHTAFCSGDADFQCSGFVLSGSNEERLSCVAPLHVAPGTKRAV